MVASSDGFSGRRNPDSFAERLVEVRHVPGVVQLTSHEDCQRSAPRVEGCEIVGIGPFQAPCNRTVRVPHQRCQFIRPSLKLASEIVGHRHPSNARLAERSGGHPERERLVVPHHLHDPTFRHPETVGQYRQLTMRRSWAVTWAARASHDCRVPPLLTSPARFGGESETPKRRRRRQSSRRCPAKNPHPPSFGVVRPRPTYWETSGISPVCVLQNPSIPSHGSLSRWRHGFESRWGYCWKPARFGGFRRSGIRVVLSGPRQIPRKSRGMAAEPRPPGVVRTALFSGAATERAATFTRLLCTSAERAGTDRGCADAVADDQRTRSAAPEPRARWN